jgi:hypothetical protein
MTNEQPTSDTGDTPTVASPEVSIDNSANDVPNIVADLIDPKTPTPAPDAEIDYAKLLPDKHGFDTAEIEKQSALLKSLNVSEDAAKALILDRIALRDGAIQAGRDLHKNEIATLWKGTQAKAIEKSKEIFGQEFDNTLALIPQALNKFLEKESADAFSQYLRETGLGNDHRFVAFMAKIGKAVSDDVASGGDGSLNIPPKPPIFPGSGLK